MDDPDFIAHPLDILLGYTPGMALPVEGKQWHPEDAWSIRPTEDAHWHWKMCNRHGQKWRRLIARVQRGITRKAYLDRGCHLVRRCIEIGHIDMADTETSEDASRAELALGYCAGLVIDENADHKHRLSAANTLLSFLKSKPTQKVENTIKSAEDFLDALE